LSKGAEADIYHTTWYGNKAISKVRMEKPYRQKLLDYEIRKNRTVHEATMLSIAKGVGVRTPFVYFVDPIATEIVMEFIEGESIKKKINQDLALQMGKCAGLLHINNIVHSDLTTSNFIKVKDNRLEDKAVDIRLVKEVLYSSYVSICAKVFSKFLEGYSLVIGQKTSQATLRKVREIELRGRYSRIT
jgi:TP53 regulating kinase-like protein